MCQVLGCMLGMYQEYSRSYLRLWSCSGKAGSQPENKGLNDPEQERDCVVWTSRRALCGDDTQAGDGKEPAVQRAGEGSRRMFLAEGVACVLREERGTERKLSCWELGGALGVCGMWYR